MLEAGIVCIGVVLQLMRDPAERVPCNNDGGEGGQLGFISTIEILNNHLPHISSIFPSINPKQQSL